MQINHIAVLETHPPIPFCTNYSMLRPVQPACQVASHVRMARDTCGGAMAIVSLGGKCLAYFSSLASDLIALCLPWYWVS